MRFSGNRTQKRMLILLGIYATLFALLAVRLSYLQLWGAEDLQARAVRQWTRNQVITAKRGRITDRTGTTLAQSATAYYITVVPSQLKADPTDVAVELGKRLNKEPEELYQKLSDRSKQEHTLARQVDRDTVDALRAHKWSGIYFGEDAVRVYPMGSFMTQVLGFCTVSGEGQDGLEAYLNKYLSGTNGRIVREADAKNRTIPYTSESFVPAINGNNVELTIDYVIQSFAEKAAREALETNQAEKIEIIVYDMQTGEILAMVNQPDFDLNNPPRSDLDALLALTRNSTVSDAYEPGSTFKILTTAAALEEGAVTTGSTFNCTGSIMVDGDKIRCWRTGNPHGHETLTEAVENSCNPVFVDLALRLGREPFYDYLDAFGIGQRTGIDMPAEATGQRIALKYVKDVDLARIGFGQSISVTPLQMAVSCSAAVTGNLMKPYIVKSISDENGDLLKSFEPEVVGNPVSMETAAIMRDILESVVENGGGRNAYIPGYRVGGKTGTAQKFEDGKLLRDIHVSSFIGFAPMDNPRICTIVVVDEPGIRPDYGSTVAAPFAKDIMENALKHLNIQPRFEDGASQTAIAQVSMPDLLGKSSAEAQRLLDYDGIKAMVDGGEGTITAQSPQAGKRIPVGSLVTLYTDNTDTQDDGSKVSVPDLEGMSIIEANRVLRQNGLQLRINGGGLAVSQEPAPGSMAAAGTVVKVTFKEP